MTGYKGLNMDMRAIHGEGRQYEIGKWYKAEEESGFLKGFCFCKKIEQIDWYYPLKKNRLFDDSINEKLERQRGKKKKVEEGSDINWKVILMGGITVLFAISILLRIFM